MEIPIGFESFEIPNKDFFAIEDLGSNKELALISVPEEFDVAELKGISFIADGAIPLKCSSDSACTQKWEIHGFPAPPKQQTNVLFLSKHGEHKFGPPISVYLNITQDFNIPYQKPLKKTKKKHLEIPENLRVRWKPFGSDEPYRKQISANSSSKDFTRSNVLKQNTSNIEINRNDDVIKKLETSFVVNEEIRTPNKKRHNVENYYDKKNLSGAIDELGIFNAKHSKKKKPNSKNTLNSNEEISNASRKNKTNSNNKLETNCTLNKDKTDKEKRKQSNANDLKSVTDSDIRKSKTTIHDCEEENGREYENDYVGVKKKKKKKTTRKDNESNENEKDENVNFSEENIKKMAKNNLSSDYKMKENKEVMALSLNDVNIKKTKTFSTDHIANEVEKTKRQVFDEDGKVNKKVKKMKKKPKKDNEANDDSKESFNDLNEAKEKKKKKKKKKLSDDNDGQMNNNMTSGADNKMGKIEKNYFSESKKVDERKKKKKIVNENEVNKCEDLSEFAQVDRKMKKEKKKKITDAQDNEISKDKSELIEYNEVQERKKKKKKKKTLSASDDEMNKEETSAYSESNKTGEKKKKKKTYSMNENGISNYEEKCASSEIDKVDERKKRKRLKPNDNEISDKKVKKESSDDDVNERKKKKKN